MLTVVRQHPGLTRWSGRSEKFLFGIAVIPLLTGEIRARAKPLVLSAARLHAEGELLRAKSVLDSYSEAGLSDATTLQQAVLAATGRLDVGGQVQGLISLSGVEGDFAVWYILADERSLTAYLLAPAAMTKVKIAYRDVMHQQARELMKGKDWSDALLLWRHLHQRQLVSQSLYLDAARCFRELGQDDDAIHVLSESILAFRSSATADFFERAGDIAIGIKTAAAQTLAEEAFNLASRNLENPKSPTQASGDPGLELP